MATVPYCSIVNAGEHWEDHMGSAGQGLHGQRQLVSSTIQSDWFRSRIAWGGGFPSVFVPGTGSSWADQEKELCQCKVEQRLGTKPSKIKSYKSIVSGRVFPENQMHRTRDKLSITVFYCATGLIMSFPLLLICICSELVHHWGSTPGNKRPKLAPTRDLNYC